MGSSAHFLYLCLALVCLSAAVRVCVCSDVAASRLCATLCKFQSKITIRNPQRVRRSRRSDYPFRLQRRAPTAMLKGRPYLLRLSEYTHTHAHPLTHTHAHTHILLQLRGKAKVEAKAKANSSQVKQLLFKLDGVDFGNNNNKNINKYLCVCV